MFLLDTQTYGRTDRREGPPLALTADFTSKLPREMERQGGKKKGQGGAGGEGRGGLFECLILLVDGGRGGFEVKGSAGRGRGSGKKRKSEK